MLAPSQSRGLLPPSMAALAPLLAAAAADPAASLAPSIELAQSKLAEAPRGGTTLRDIVSAVTQVGGCSE